ncbi:MAG: transcription termination factor NusA [Planctomycetes bacterium]|nr:transcription termination factor NusA [Planctomycetota bacterium]
MNQELVRHIDSIHRDKGIDREVLFLALEEALTTAIKKRFDEVEEDLEIVFNRESGELDSNYEINFEVLGRIFAQTVKQTWFTRIREAERDVFFNEWEEQVNDIVTGTTQRFEGDSVIINLGKIEGILPKSERVRGENYHVGDRLRALILEVKKVGLKVKVILSRSSTGLVQRLFELEVPEVDDGIIEIKKLEREPGYRTKIAVTSSDARVDCVGACVGVRGTRIKSIIDELGGERIDIIRWNDDPKQMLINALQPAEVSHIELDIENHKALVLVEEDQLSLAIGRKGQNVRLASKLCGWDIDIMTRQELEDTLKNDEVAASDVEGAPADAPAEEAGAAEADAGQTDVEHATEDVTEATPAEESTDPLPGEELAVEGAPEDAAVEEAGAAEADAGQTDVEHATEDVTEATPAEESTDPLPSEELAVEPADDPTDPATETIQ